MEKSQTITGKDFYFEGDLAHGLTIRTCDKQGRMKDNGFYVSKGTIDTIRKAIIAHGEIPMGACRDNPAKDSIGHVLFNGHKSPQSLSYVIPLLEQEHFCIHFKKGKAYYIRFTKRETGNW